MLMRHRWRAYSGVLAFESVCGIRQLSYSKYDRDNASRAYPMHMGAGTESGVEASLYQLTAPYEASSRPIKGKFLTSESLDRQTAC